ncbi:MAG: hypothetical protein H6733_08245 [Alphaproteobacteria bacterium]|nr:hypothetical protein [Alphaproteobacteria bacterium]
MTESEDPRELARRLAQEAKARAMAKKLAEEAKARVAAEQPAPEPAPKVSLADRAPKPMSARDALKAAIAKEEAEAEARAKAEARRAAQAAAAPAPAPPTPPAPVASAPAPVPAAAPPPAVAPAPAPALLKDPRGVLAERLPEATLHEVRAVAAPQVLQALFTAHRVRAAAEGDLALIVTADVLIDAAGRLPAGALHAAKVTVHGVDHAVFVDAASGVLLGQTGSPELYLAGI